MELSPTKIEMPRLSTGPNLTNKYRNVSATNTYLLCIQQLDMMTYLIWNAKNVKPARHRRIKMRAIITSRVKSMFCVKRRTTF